MSLPTNYILSVEKLISHHSKLWLVLLVWGISYSATAQQFLNFSEKSKRYFTEQALKEVIREGAVETAKNKGFPVAVFEENLRDNEAFLLQTLQPYAAKKFRWIENTSNTEPERGTPQFEKRKSLYAKELKRAVRDAINENSGLAEYLFEVDETDRIVSFGSDITVGSNGWIRVVETIKIYNGDGSVNSKNNDIQRGIVRTFPTRYLTKWKFVHTVPFKLKEVLRNGEREPYKLQEAENGIALYAGRADIKIERGYHTYQFTYETARQLIFHENEDELYWNVNGNGWIFTADEVRCKITFPESANILENNCYTGVQGSTAQTCQSKTLSPNTIEFKTNNRLNAYEGLTVAAAVNKGVLVAPTFYDEAKATLRDNLIVPILLAVVLLLFIINFIKWWRVGRDPKAGTIIPQFEPPKNMSPADVGYLLLQDYKPHLFAASIVDHAVHRMVDIEVKREGLIIKSPAYYFKKPARIRGEAERDYTRYTWYGYDIEDLYGEKAAKGEYNSIIASKYSSLHSQLKSRLLIEQGSSNSFQGMFSLNDGFAAFGLFVLVMAGFGTLIYFIINYSIGLLIASIALLVLGVVMQVVFLRIMSAYTVEGRKILDHVLGFKMYLETAEQRMFDALNPPQLTIQLFEKYLPYSIALQCENRWAAKFESIINKALEGGYQPAYFRSDGMSFTTASFASSISSGMSGIISSASTPPSSSGGGSGGGGSSGGGGGGGGGGGW